MRPHKTYKCIKIYYNRCQMNGFLACDKFKFFYDNKLFNIIIFIILYICTAYYLILSVVKMV